MKDTVGTIDNGGTSTTGTYFSQEAGVGGATWNPLVHTAGLDDDDAREILLAAGGGRKQRLVLELDGGTLDPGAERRQRNKWFEVSRVERVAPAFCYEAKGSLPASRTRRSIARGRFQGSDCVDRVFSSICSPLN